MPEISSRDVRETWRLYNDANEHCRKVHDLLLEHYLALARHEAERLHKRMPHKAEADDLMSAAVFGLMHAISNFDSDSGVQFEAYAAPRIRAAMFDELRTLEGRPERKRYANDLGRGSQRTIGKLLTEFVNRHTSGQRKGSDDRGTQPL